MTSGPSVGPHELHQVALGVDAHDPVLASHLLAGSEVGQVGNASPFTAAGKARCPFRPGRMPRPASHRELGGGWALRESKAPAITSDSAAWGFRPVRRTRSAAPA